LTLDREIEGVVHFDNSKRNAGA
jgi:uncharacterized membrane protein YeaQ/YmgE (transglycosylase-associated protein family)